MKQTYYKLKKVIWSCETFEHFQAAQKLINLFYNMYRNQSEAQSLQKWLNKRIRFKDLA